MTDTIEAEIAVEAERLQAQQAAMQDAPETETPPDDDGGVFDSEVEVDFNASDDDAPEATLGPSPVEPTIDPIIERRARAMGWRPKNEWQGPAAVWKDADAFVDFADQRMPALRKENEKFAGDINAMREAMQGILKQNRQLQERVGQIGTATLKQAHQAAMDEGDFDKATQIAERMGAEKAAMAWQKQQNERQERQASQPPEQNPDQIPAFKNWASQNNWYGSDQARTDYAISIAEKVAQIHNADTYAFYDTIGREVERRFGPVNPGNAQPAPAQAQRSGYAPQGESTVRRASNGTAKPGWNSLPAEARQIGEDLVQNGTMTRAEYVTAYFKD